MRLIRNWLPEAVRGAIDDYEVQPAVCHDHTAMEMLEHSTSAFGGYTLEEYAFN